MGWFRQTTNGQTTIWHDGVFSTVYSDIVIRPDDNLGIVLLYGVGGILPIATTFPKMRAGALAIAVDRAPELPGQSLVTIGRLAGVITLILLVAAIMDLTTLRRWSRWATTAPTGRVVLGLAARWFPIALLLSLPWVLQVASGRAFSLEAIFFAMLDVTLGLAIVGTVLAFSAILRLAFLAQNAVSPELVDPGNEP